MTHNPRPLSAKPRLEALEDRTLFQATQLQVLAPGTVYSGPTYGVTVQALDRNSQVDPTYAGTVHFDSSDPAATLPADYTFTAADRGAHTFLSYLPAGGPGVVTFGTPGTQTVTAADTADASISGRDHVTVLAESDPPQVGGVTDTTARVFTRTSGPATVKVQFSVHESLSSPTAVNATTSAASDFTAILSLAGLRPATTYYYRIFVDGVPQQTAPYPSFTTFPSPGTPADFSVGLIADTATATEFPRKPAPAYAQVAADNPAFVLQIGDFDHRNPQTLAEFYAMDRQVRGPYDAAGKQWATSIAPNFPVDHVYDDHDSGTNNADKNSPTRRMAIQSYQLYYPTYNLVNPAEGIYHSFTYGQAQFFMLDTRDERDPDGTPDGPGKSMLGADQLAWLENGLLNSSATWKVLVTTVALNQTSGSDGWSAFGTEWAGLMNFIQQNRVQGVFALSADLHSNGAIDDGTNSGVPELNVPYNNLPGGHPTDVVGKGWTQGFLIGKNEGGYGLVQFLTNPDRVVFDAKAHDGSVRLRYTVTAVGSRHFVVSRQPAVTAGAPFSFTVTAVDASGHVLPGYQGTVHFTSTDSRAVLPADYTFTAADAGRRTFPATLFLAGTATTLAVTDAADSMTGVIEQTVVAGAAKRLTGKAVTVTAGVPFVEEIKGLDAYGNVAAGYTGTVHFTSTEKDAVLPANYTFTSGTFGSYDNGVHDFTFTLNTTGTQTVVVKDTAGAVRGKFVVTVGAPAAGSSVPVPTGGTGDGELVPSVLPDERPFGLFPVAWRKGRR